MTPDSPVPAEIRPRVEEPALPPPLGIGDTRLPWSTQWRMTLAGWWWITVGGATSALFCLGLFSVAGCWIAVPIGAIAGAIIGVPGAAVLTAWIRRRHDPPGDLEKFSSMLETIGMVGALAGCSLVMWWWLGPWLLVNSDFTLRTAVPGLAIAAFAVAAVAASGRWVGRRLASHYLRAWGLAAPTSWIGHLR